MFNCGADRDNLWQWVFSFDVSRVHLCSLQHLHLHSYLIIIDPIWFLWTSKTNWITLDDHKESFLPSKLKWNYCDRQSKIEISIDFIALFASIFHFNVTPIQFNYRFVFSHSSAYIMITIHNMPSFYLFGVCLPMLILWRFSASLVETCIKPRWIRNN